MPEPERRSALAAMSRAVTREPVRDPVPLPDLSGDLSAQLYVQLYNKLATALSLRGVVGHDSQMLLSMQIPGLDIRPGMDPTDPRTQYMVSNALNRTLLCSWSVIPGVATITDVYKSILDGKETPLVTLPPEKLRQLEEAQALLGHADGEPTQAYVEYERRMLAYLTALDDYEAARATFENGGPEVPPSLATARDAAERAWVLEGHKREIETAIATVDSLEGLEPALLWRKLAQRFDEYTLTLDPKTGSQFQFVTSNPPYEKWFDPTGWSDFRFDDKDFLNQRGTGGGGFGDECRCNCCCDSSSADQAGGLVRSRAVLASCAPAARRELPIALTDTEFVLTGKLRRVEIIRPWMDTSILFSRAWRWSPASVAYGVVVSSGGDIAGRLAPTGMMPVLPLTGILAADIVIRWDDGGATSRRIAERLSAGHEVRFGPFRIREAPGKHGEITIPGPQLIGFISQLIPSCPNPDPLLIWPTQDVEHGYWPS